MIFYKFNDKESSFTSYGQINEQLEIEIFDIDIPGRTIKFRPSLIDRIRIRVYEYRKDKPKKVANVRVMDILKNVWESIKVTFEGAKYEFKHRRKDG